MQAQIESGAELLARLSDKPSLHELEKTFFVEGLRNNSVIEVGGNASSGKTLFLSQILAKCLLPSYHRSVQIGGCNASAILINTDHHFQVSKLTELMFNIVKAADRANEARCESDVAIDDLIHSCLRKLHIVNCYDYDQLFLILHTLDDLFLSKSNVALLAIDSLTAYYWQDYGNGLLSVHSHVKKLLSLVQTYTLRHNVVTIYTRSHGTLTENKEKTTILSADRTMEQGNYRISLSGINGCKEIICAVQTARSFRTTRYPIYETGRRS